MAEGFAKQYGSDVMEVASAGLSPASIIQPLTYEVMKEKNITLEGQQPKDLSSVNVSDFDLLINMSGVKLPSRIPVEVREWKIEDPIGKSKEFYCQIRDQVEDHMMKLILELRRAARNKPSGSPKNFVRLVRRAR
jgi:arsenate reductase (thioredoxin)